MAEIAWPAGWPDDARAGVERHLGGEARLRIVVGNPATSIDGSVVEGHVYLDGDVPTVIYDRSGRSDVYPWPLPAGPVLRVYELRARRRPALVFAHVDWNPRRGE